MALGARALAALGFTAFSCSREPDGGGDAPPGAQTAHSTVAAPTSKDVWFAIGKLRGEQGTCAGAIVGARAPAAFVLTAEHCATGAKTFTVGSQPHAVELAVASLARHPTLDLAVVRVLGAGQRTRFISLNAAQVGRDETLEYPLDIGGPRQRLLPLPIYEAGATSFIHLQAFSGLCAGDSGAPGLLRQNSSYSIASVHSAGDRDCRQFTESVAVTEDVVDWVRSVTSRAVFSCEDCTVAALSGQGDCSRIYRSCQENRLCRFALECAKRCRSERCRAACAAGAAQHTEAAAVAACVVAGCRGLCDEQ